MSESLRILITDPHLRGGGQVRYVTNLVHELIARGHTAAIACKQGSILEAVARDAGCGLFNDFSLRGGLRPAVWRHDLAAMRRVLDDFRPIILHVNGSQDHWIGALANRGLGFPAVLVRTRHNTYPVSDNFANRVLNRRWTDYQIVVCDTVRRDLAKQRAFDADRMHSIHNGVDAGAFAPDAAARADARREFGYGEDHVVVGIAARLVTAKGHTYLFQAVARLRERYPALRVLVLGEGRDEALLKEECRTLGIEGITHFAGYRTDMPRCVNAVDIGVQPSIDCDTSSFTLKEQMAAEKPVVASDYGGLTEIVDDGVEGYIVPTGTVDPLAEALDRLIASPELRRAMGKRGRERVLHDFTVQVFGERTIAAYRRAMQVRHDRHAA